MQSSYKHYSLYNLHESFIVHTTSKTNSMSIATDIKLIYSKYFKFVSPLSEQSFTKEYRWGQNRFRCMPHP